MTNEEEAPSPPPPPPTSNPHPHHTALIFPSQQSSISHLLASLKRTTLSVHNRLASIRSDADFVARAAASFGPISSSSSAGKQRPLVANERCGSWYVPPDRKAASAYFKSTDGHERAWKFSTRRLNLHLVDLIEANDGIIIVDSTRRGKRMPDALSTTIPIWCTVVNQALLPENPLSQNLFLPPYVSASTHSQITALIPGFLASLGALNLSLPTSLTKPLRPLWITHDSSIDDEASGGQVFEDYRPVICCTASRRVVGSEVDEGGYVQGAGDDTENWAGGLTPPVFWKHLDLLTEAAEADLPDLIATLVEQHKDETKDDASRVQLTPHIAVCALPISPDTHGNCIITLTSQATAKETWVKSPAYIEVGLGKSKTASRNLRLALPDICDFATKFLAKQSPDSPGQIILACDSGKDLSVGTALALSCYLFDSNDQFRIPENVNFTKTLIKIKLGSIMTVYPAANPSRATLQSVNSFLMDWQK